MFLLDRIDFLALVGLFTQTALTWVLLAVFTMLRGEGGGWSPVRRWAVAFAALAVALTAVSVRFFFAFDLTPPPGWGDGDLRVRVLYATYMAGKAMFSILLVIGAFGLARRRDPPWIGRLGGVLVLVLGLSPFAVESINTLLVVQAPLVAVCALVAWSVLRRAEPADATGYRLVRAGLLGTFLAWLVHGVCAWVVVPGEHALANYLLAFNSHIDAAVELVLAAGLIVALLQESAFRLRAAEAERARLRAEIERDTRLHALGTLVSGVAHELNNPLTAILGFAEELEDPERSRYAAQVVREQADRCRGVVRSLSALAGVRPEQREDVDLRALVERVGRGFERELERSGCRIALAPGGPQVASVDRIGVEQVLTNLIANAIHASPPGGAVGVDVRGDGAHVELDVTDDGPGVPASARDRLFEPFYTTKPRGEGTGLGLAVAFAIARAHRGLLSVGDRRDGRRGGRFTLRLPRASADELQVGRTEAAGRDGSARASASAVAPGSLLVIDDESSIREVVRLRLEREGWKISEAPSGAAALELLRDGLDPDVILCDLRMPGLGGDGFRRELERTAPDLLARCIFFSGDLTSPEAMAFSRRSAAPLLSKPLDFGELLALACSIRSARRSLGAAPR